MRIASPCRALALVLALAGLSCARDLELPSSSPPRIDTVQVLGLEGSPAPVPLPVLGGELVAIGGGGFTSGGAVEVEIGGFEADLLDVEQGRIVARVPTLATFGAADLKVTTSVGFRTESGALRYDGPGQPAGFGTSDLPTSPPLGFVAPVQPPGSTGFSDLAIAIGASDSALLVVPAVGVAVTTIPLGLVPASAAARLVAAGPDFRLQVLALARGGEAALGSALLSSSSSVASRVAARPLASTLNTRECSFPQVMFTNGGTPVAAWVTPAGAHKIGTIDMTAAEGGTYGLPAGGVAHDVGPGGAAVIVGWAPWKGSSVVFAAGNELYVYDASTPATPPSVLVDSLAQPVSSRLAAGCTPVQAFHTLSAASSGLTDALAVSYRGGDGDRVALVDLTPSATAAVVHRGLAGTIATSLALVPDPPYGTSPNLQWAVLAAGIGNLFRFRPLDVGGDPSGLCHDLVPDAALPLSAESAVLPTFGGMIAAAAGTRLLSTTPDGDLITVLPPSLTSAGSVFRVASYAGLSIQSANIGGQVVPVAVAEHASFESSLSELDTGSALLLVSLAGDQGSLALGGSGYGRGAVWIDPAPGAGALAYTGDLPDPPAGVVARGGAAAVTGFTAGACPNEDVRVTGTRPVANGSDLVAQGPARSGALGPEGVRRYGPASAPVYTATDTTLGVYVPGAGNIACLAGANPNWDPGTCPPDATLELGVTPLDVTLSVGDRTVAVRSLETDLGACGSAPGFPAVCPAGDLLCLRATCPPAMSLQLVRAGAAPATLALPGRPAGLAADRGGGFLVTLPCAVSSAAGGDDCFPASPICDAFLTGPGGADGALVLVAEDGSAVECLAVLPALAGPVSVTPNGAEAWVTGTAFGAQILSRLALPRRTSDGAIDPSRPAERITAEALGAAAQATGAFPMGGVAFTPDGGTGIVTVPGQFRIVLYQ